MSEEKDKVEEKDAAVTETAEDETKNQDAELEALNDEFFREMDIQGADISEGDRHLSEEKKKKLSDRKKVSKKKKKIRPFHVLVAILCLILALAVIGVGILLFLRSQGESMLRQGEIKEDITAPDGVQIEEDGKYVIYNGEKYCYNEHIINILGILYPYIAENTESIKFDRFDLSKLYDIKGYMGKIEVFFGEITDFHEKINDVYNIILNGNVGITNGYIDVSIKNMPVIKKNEE